VEQLLQLQRLKSSTLAGTAVVAIAPDPPGKTRELIGKVLTSKDVLLTHRFLSDPDLEATDAYGIRNAESKTPVPHPTAVLVDRDGREVWRFSEKEYRRRPTDEEIRAAVGKLRRTK
jgi:peroxiredoxin